MGLAERFKCIKSITENKKTFSRVCLHVGVGAFILALTVTGMIPMAIANAARNSDDTRRTVQTVTSAEETKPQTRYAVESWWKAGIGDYELAEYTRKEVAVKKKSSKKEKEVKYPDISFEVTAAEGAQAAQGAVYPHAECGTRDISKEYYTVRSVDTGEIISDNAHDLVCRVLDGEMYGSFSDEAMRAQTVAIYSYIRYCDANGMLPVVAVADSYSSRIENIVKSVEGQVCTYGGVPINALFCASTGGNSIGSEYVWSRSLPYMKPVIGKYDSIDPNYGVNTYMSAAQVKSLIEDSTGITLDPDKVKSWFEITDRSYGKYVDGIKIAGKDSYTSEGTTRYLSGAQLRNILGNDSLRSTAFDISYENGVFCFTTYGYGHGVGMSQWGAQLLSIKDGLKYDQILRYYYSGIAVCVSSVNKEAEERYGKIVDVSQLQEASPSDSTTKVPDKDKQKEDKEDIKEENKEESGEETSQTQTQASESETTTVAEETTAEAEVTQPADETTPEESTLPDESEGSEDIAGSVESTESTESIESGEGIESAVAEVTTPAQTTTPVEETTTVSE